MNRVVSGLARFQNEVDPDHRELFETLASRQSPETLFITCSDSRIDPCMTQSVSHMPAVSSWLQQAESARFTVQENHAHLSGSDLVHALIEQNVLAQLDNLRTHAAVGHLHGWVYDIGSGEVRSLDPAVSRFMPLEARSLATAPFVGHKV